MKSAQAPCRRDSSFHKSCNGEENLFCGIVRDLLVADNRRDRLAVRRSILIFSVTAKNEPITPTGKLFDTGNPIYPNVRQRRAFDNWDRFWRLQESHRDLPGESATPGMMTHKFHNSQHSNFACVSSEHLDGYSVTAIPPAASFARGFVSLTSRSSLAAGDLAARMRLFLSEFALKARQNLYAAHSSRTNRAPVCGKSVPRAHRGETYSIRARDRHAALPLRSRTTPQPVEAIPGWGTSHSHAEANA